MTARTMTSDHSVFTRASGKTFPPQTSKTYSAITPPGREIFPRGAGGCRRLKRRQCTGWNFCTSAPVSAKRIRSTSLCAPTASATRRVTCPVRRNCAMQAVFRKKSTRIFKLWRRVFRPPRAEFREKYGLHMVFRTDISAFP